jgi:hypothetical protein
MPIYLLIDDEAPADIHPVKKWFCLPSYREHIVSAAGPEYISGLTRYVVPLCVNGFIPVISTDG